jgi:hypothetical protein
MRWSQRNNSRGKGCKRTAMYDVTINNKKQSTTKTKGKTKRRKLQPRKNVSLRTTNK